MSETIESEVDDLLRPVFEMFKEQAAAAIREKRAEIANILRVNYEADAVARPKDLPAPRLQLRWEVPDDSLDERFCHYELVFALQEYDCRNDAKTGFAVIELGRTRQGGGRPDWGANLGRETPYRDGAHARWDAAHLGLPVYVIAPDGRHALMDQSRHPPAG